MTDTHVVHETGTGGDSGMGFLLGIIALIFFLFILLYFGLPLLRNAGNTGSPPIQVPDKIDVNVNQ